MTSDEFKKEMAKLYYCAPVSPSQAAWFEEYDITHPLPNTRSTDWVNSQTSKPIDYRDAFRKEREEWHRINNPFPIVKWKADHE